VHRDYSSLPGANLMPRRAAVVRPMISFHILPAVLCHEVSRAGEELERIVVKKTRRYFFQVTTRTRAIKRELREAP
jgi:hypothetical protein